MTNLKQVRQHAVEYLEAFSNAHGASGFEGEVESLLTKDLKNWGHLKKDLTGSVAFTKGEGSHVMIAAHMDEVGFRVKHITSQGFIKFVKLGGWWAHVLLAQRVSIKTSSGDKVLGVIGSKPVHFLPEQERSKVLDLEALYIDIGVDNAEEVKALGIKLGDVIVPDSTFTQIGKPGRFMAKAFDNRVGCAALVQCAEALPNGVEGIKLSLAGTVQEEVGLRGAKTLASLLRPDVAIILEGAPADDTDGFALSEAQGKIGGGVQIRMHDPRAILTPWLVTLAQNTAEEFNIPYQLAVKSSGGTDAGVFTYANEGIPTIVLGVPSRYIHTHNSIIELEDYLSMVQLAVELSKKLVSRLTKED